MILALLAVPALSGLLALLTRADAARRRILVASAAVHAALTAACAWRPPAPAFGGWLALDAPGLLFLGIASLLFLAAAVYAAGYLGREPQGRREDVAEAGGVFVNAPEAVFTGCLLLFLATMTLVTLSQHVGLLWVAVEATTLASAPLIYFHRHHRSLEATWKYLLICSVGIGLALLGNFCLAVCAQGSAAGPVPMLVPELVRRAGALQGPWLKAFFLCLLVGYGTKMGLAPLHTWLPDAHSEAPSLVSALLSGALLNCAFLGILRAQQVCAAAGQAAFGRGLLVGFGLLSMGVAAVFILGQADYKRLLAYSSVEHMGILALGTGLGAAGAAGAMLHAVGHSLSKAMLFLVAGNILAAYRTKAAAAVGGVLRALPVSGALWVAGFLAVTGSPPFVPFLSEFGILRAALGSGRPAVAAAYLAFLSLAFVGMASVMLGMAQGPRPERLAPARREPLTAVGPPLLLGTLALVLGLWIPAPLASLLRAAAAAVGGP